mgnify:CR=1 FL=1
MLFLYFFFSKKEKELFDTYIKADISRYSQLTTNQLTTKGNIVHAWFEITRKQDSSGSPSKSLIADSLSIVQQFITHTNLDFQLCYFHDYSKHQKIEKNSTLKILDFEYFGQNLEKYFENVITRYLFKNRNVTAAEVISQQIERINNTLKGIETISKVFDIEDNKLIFKNFAGKRIGIDDLSAGEKQLFFRSIYLNSLDLKDSIVLADEPELSLHPTWQRSISSLYQNTGDNNQVFLATHSPHVISSVKPESLFCLYPNKQSDKIEVFNMEKQGQQTKGLEPNRVLEEIMDTPLRDYQTQAEIDFIDDNIFEEYNNPKFIRRIEKLTEQLGVQDPFIIRLNHQLLLLKRKNK